MSTYIIAEIGTSHGGDPARAAELIHAAKESGADCAKFQCVIADEIVHPKCGPIDLPGGSTPIRERFKALERAVDFYRSLQELCRKSEIDFLCTVFGPQSAAVVESLSPSRHKIASPEANHVELLSLVASYRRPVILSTGVTTLGDVERAIEKLTPAEVTVLHCVTAYPAAEADYNLRVLPLLRGLLGTAVGVSDHTEHPSLIPGLAVALGATMIEKHFALDRSGEGLDDPIALDPTLFTELAATVRRIDALAASQTDPVASLVIDEFCAEYGELRVERALGDGVKRLAPGEASNYRSTRRSLLATRDLPAGHVLGESDLSPLRAENLRPGLDPSFSALLTGATLTMPLRDGNGIGWEHLLRRPD